MKIQGQTPTLCGLTVALAAVAGCTSEVAAQRAVTSGVHGDAPEAAQRGALAVFGVSDTGALPRGIDAVAWSSSIPLDNALSKARIDLGRRLYFEKRLSSDQTVSCATCHDATRAFADLRKTSEGIAGQQGTRNAPTTMNAALLGNQFWDGRAQTVEDQAKLPILNPIEMGMPSPEAAVAAIAGDPAYVELFQKAYGRAVNYDDLGRAIGAFERTLIFLDAPADKYLEGDASAISEGAKRGWILFNGKARCTACHPMNRSNPLGTDNRFHNIGVAARNRAFEPLAARALAELDRDPTLAEFERLALGSELSELGRFMVSKNYADIGSFRSPQLRNVGVTGPYMHDGSMETLWDVMDHYNKGGEANPYLDGGMEPLALSEAEIDDLVAFMFTLTDRRLEKRNDEELERQRAIARTNRPFRDLELARRQRVSFDPRN